MYLVIQKTKLLQVLRQVSGVVEKRATATTPVLSHVLMHYKEDLLSVTATDQEVEIVASIELRSNEKNTEGALSVPFRKLYDITRVLPDDAILSLKSNEQGKVLLTCGRSRYILSSFSEQQFPDVGQFPETVRFSVNKKALLQAIENTAFAMADQDVRFYLNGMLFDITLKQCTLVAADGHRLAVNQLALSSSNNQSARVIVPRKGVLEIQRLLHEEGEEVTLIFGDNHLRLLSGQIILTSKLLEGKFPDYRGVIPKGGDKYVVGPRETLKKAFVRAAALFSEKVRGVHLQFSKNLLRIVAKNAEQDEVEEEIEIAYQGPNLEVGFNVRYLIELLGVIATEKVQLTFSQATESALIQGEGENQGIYVLMPMRI